MEIIDIIGQLDGGAFCFALAFIFLDVATGYAQAVANKTVSSDVLRRGFWHKLALVFAMLAAGLADMTATIELDLGFSLPIFTSACGYVIVMELTSILENIKRMNPNIADSGLLSLFKIRGDDAD